MPASLAPFVLLAPALLIGVALWSFVGNGLRPRGILLGSRLATMTAMALAVLAALLVIVQGAVTSPLIGGSGIGLSVRLDAISCSMFLLVAFVGLIVVQYSRNYLDGDARQGEFLGGLCLTVAAVIVLVLAGNLFQLVAAWMATSLSLHRLLVFYAERPAAMLAARKKFIVARSADTCLIIACVLLATSFGSSDIGAILVQARALPVDAIPANVQIAALLIAVAALLKSAQFPTHGWLPEVMETPTPVSALLHAGIINAGGFLMIRFADVMLLSAPVLHFVAIVGGFTALFGGVVMLTQTSVKTSLAWSTIAQMGFMTLQCGLGAFAIALLHLIAHSLYKAHAFLASGSVVELVRTPTRTQPRVRVVLLSLAMALSLYAAIGCLFGLFSSYGPAALTLGAILVMGVSMLMAPSLQGISRAALVGRSIATAAVTTLIFFVLETSVVRLTASILPPIPTADGLGLLIMGLAIVSFAAVTVLQSLAPRWIHLPAWHRARVHLNNGFYINAWFNRVVGSSYLRKKSIATTRNA